MKLRFKIKNNDAPATTLLRLEKYYVNVLGSYLDFFEEKLFQLPQWKLDKNKIPRYVINIVTRDNISLSIKQGIFIILRKSFNIPSNNLYLIIFI